VHCFEKVGHCDSVEGHVVALVLWEFSLGIMARVKRADVGGLTPVFGRLGSIVAAPLAVAAQSPDVADGVGEVQTPLPQLRTPRTGETKSDCSSALPRDVLRTERTGSLNSLYAAEEESKKGINICATLKEFGTLVRCVRSNEPGERDCPAAPTEPPGKVTRLNATLEPFEALAKFKPL